MRESGMLDHIVAHSLQVCRVALSLADQMKSTHPGLDHQMLQAAALLHDITKTRSFDTGENHAETGAEFLAELGFPEVAELVRQHVRLDSYSGRTRVDDAAVINYADKRVLHDAVVSLDERMQYIYERYGKTAVHQQRIRKLWQVTAALENRIFGQLAISPADLPALLVARGIAADFEAYQKAAGEPMDEVG